MVGGEGGGQEAGSKRQEARGELPLHDVEGSRVVDGLEQLVLQHRVLVVVGHVELEKAGVGGGQRG